MRLYLIFVLSILLSACTDLFFYPDNVIRLTPKDLGLAYQEIKLRNDNNTELVGWYLPSSQKTTKARVLFLHGNAENISTHISSVYWLPSFGYDVLMAEYQGYGLSNGSTDINSVHDSALRFLNYLLNCKNCPPIIIYGQSLGGAIAYWLSSKVDEHSKSQVCMIVTEGAFSDYQAMARDSLSNLGFFKYLFYPFSFFVRNDFSPTLVSNKFEKPILIIHAQADQIVPSSHAVALHEANLSSTLWLVEGAGHLSIFNSLARRNEFASKLICK